MVNSHEIGSLAPVTTLSQSVFRTFNTHSTRAAADGAEAQLTSGLWPHALASDGADTPHEEQTRQKQDRCDKTHKAQSHVSPPVPHAVPL